MNHKRLIRSSLVIAAAAIVAAPLIGRVSHAHQPDSGKNTQLALADPPPAITGDDAQAAPASQPAGDPNKVIITLGDQKVTAGEFQALVAGLPPQVQQQFLSQPGGKRRLAEELVNIKLLAAKAKEQKVEDSAKFKNQYEQLLAQSYMAQLAEDSAADQKYFNDHKSEFEQVKARHILIATSDSPVPAAKKLSDADAKAKAVSIKARLDKGEDFAAIAKAESDDTSSGAEGGSLGTVGRGQMVPAFEEATFALKKGEISGPVRTQFGYHIIQATDRVAAPFAEVRRQVAQRRLEAMLDAMRKDANPTYDESFFGKAPTTEPTSKP